MKELEDPFDKNSLISQKELIERLDYVDGKLFWKKCQKLSLIGKRAGTKHIKGYRTINLHMHPFLEHRIIFMFHHGYMPNQIDHINEIKDDNRIENLREATNSQNHFNVSRKKKSSTGVKGIRKLGNKFQVRLVVNKKTIYLGVYKTLEEAKEVIQQGRRLHHGEYARD